MRNTIIVIAIVIIAALGYFMMSNKGPVAKAGSVVTVHYVGTLTDGTKFDASADHGGPLRFSLGQGYVIPGWEEGVMGMAAGEKKHLVIPPAKAYGDKQVGPIPPNSTLVFDVEMLKVEPAVSASVASGPVQPYFVTTEPVAPVQTEAATTTEQAPAQDATATTTKK